MALTDAERVFVEALRTVRAKLMDTITGLDDTIAEIEQAADARVDPVGGITVREHPPEGYCTCGELGGQPHHPSVHTAMQQG